MSEDDFKNPLADLVTAAAMMHDMYLAFVAGGFTEYQALILVAEFMKASKPSPS